MTTPTTVGAARIRGRRAGRMHWLAPIVFALVLVTAWELVVRAGVVAEVFLPAPSTLFGRFTQELAGGPLLQHTGVTLVEALVGSVIAVLVAVPLGYLVARVRWADLALTPYITASQAIPAVAIAPLLALWIGYGLAPIAILCAIVAFFPMLITTVPVAGSRCAGLRLRWPCRVCSRACAPGLRSRSRAPWWASSPWAATGSGCC